MAASASYTMPPSADARFTTDLTVLRLLDKTHPNAFEDVSIIISAGTVTPSLTASLIVIAKTVPSVTPVTLPSAPAVGKTYTVVDGAGNAATYPITVSAAINGGTSFVMATNWQSTRFVYTGTGYVITGAYL